MAKKTLQKLELTWIGKGEEPKLEPRILIENPEYSYGDPNSPNMLIHGDNLLALKALEQDYAGKVKCIYIDPPYNTGSAFEHYDDNLEHSIWLNLMSIRLKVLRSLLKNDGLIWISIDDKEVHYLKILCDEIFGRDSYVSTVCVKMSTASGVKTSHRDKTIIKEKEFILCYSKNSSQIKLNPQYIPKLEWDNEFQYFLDKNNSDDVENWSVKRLKDILKLKNIPFDPSNSKFKDFVTLNASSIWRRAFIRNEYKELSQNNPDKIFVDTKGSNYYYRGRQMYFFSDRIHNCFTEDGYKDLPSFLLGDFWSDINTGKLFNEGGINFRNGKKPEFLVARIIEMSTVEGDLVFDSFLGSGTTAAVATKMKRNWIGIELGEHSKTLCIPRLKGVINNSDQGGISKAVNWQGGGGFKFYTLAPSLLKKDKFGNEIINPSYNADMLAAAMAKQEGFKYQPHESTYYKQGQSAEQDFIFTTTQFLTVEALDSIQDEMQPGETLLICCKSFQKECKGKFGNITIKKIPLMLLGRCEYGKEDYSLNIINMPSEAEFPELENEQDFVDDKMSVQELAEKSKKQEKNEQPGLFD
jgi:adenine-specific DNA-methyltransferase